MPSAAVTKGRFCRDFAPDRSAATGACASSRSASPGPTSSSSTTSAARRRRPAPASPGCARLPSRIEDAADTDPQYLAVLAAVADVHRPEATPADYARAAPRALRTSEQ
ncbi:DUF6354 family protein [Streptomyces sp. OfavH-34-F]|nr:DUF6354 family protein [Streptomyces sp. OfavH-34-F]MCG7523974.1 DUF6354 family protein [Streptomyces sp. OfavH-34-F]